MILLFAWKEKKFGSQKTASSIGWSFPPSFHPIDTQSRISHKRGSWNKSLFYQLPSHTIITEDVLDFDFESRLIMETVSHHPLSFLAGFWEQWMIAESTALFPMSVWIRSIHRLPQTHRQQHKHTQPLDIVPHDEVSLPKLLYETTSQPSGLYGPCSTRTIQPSRCCLSGPAANTAWWD